MGNTRETVKCIRSYIETLGDTGGGVDEPKNSTLILSPRSFPRLREL